MSGVGYLPCASAVHIGTRTASLPCRIVVSQALRGCQMRFRFPPFAGSLGHSCKGGESGLPHLPEAVRQAAVSDGYIRWGSTERDNHLSHEPPQSGVHQVLVHPAVAHTSHIRALTAQSDVVVGRVSDSVTFGCGCRSRIWTYCKHHATMARGTRGEMPHELSGT